MLVFPNDLSTKNMNNLKTTILLVTISFFVDPMCSVNCNAHM